MVERTTHPPSSSQMCISFDLFDGNDVDHIMREPPFIHGRTLCPGCPRFVVPLYGREVAIGGIAGLGNVESSLNSHLHQHYGHDIIVGSRVELDDNIYCMVLKDWPTMQAFLHENQNGLPTEWFLYGVSVGKPTLLFSFNTQGAPPNLVSRPMAFSTPDSSIQPQFDFFHTEFSHFMSTLNTMFECISHAEQCLEQNNQMLLGMMSAQCLLGNYRMNLLLLTNEQDHLTAQHDHYQDQLLASPDSASHQHLFGALKEVDDHHSAVALEIEQVHMEMQAICLSLTTHDHLALPSVPPHIVSTSPLPSPVLPSSAPSPSSPLHVRSCSPNDMTDSCGLPRLHFQSVADSQWALGTSSGSPSMPQG
ncbi:hypothetical protein EDC04DRAFT_2898177 [Pisolithus marmoratus]|nr:hypothetical protein EDC04DRAFT_2898177 [Pisolithus marmoratus]